LKEVIMSKGTVLVVASSADKFELQAGKVIPTGFYLNELTVPVRATIDAGYDIVLATPKGTKPVLDERSREEVSDCFARPESEADRVGVRRYLLRAQAVA
jgi:putative intracellular protease/amidase